MVFENMNAIQRRLHNAACVLGADGDEHGFEQLQRDTIDEIQRLREEALVLRNWIVVAVMQLEAVADIEDFEDGGECMHALIEKGRALAAPNTN